MQIQIVQRLGRGALKMFLSGIAACAGYTCQQGQEKAENAEPFARQIGLYFIFHTFNGMQDFLQLFCRQVQKLKILIDT